MRRIVAAALAFLLAFSDAAWAATTPNSVVTAQTLKRGILQFTSSSSAGTYATLYTAGTDGSICRGMYSTNSDSATHLLTVQLFNGGTAYGGVALTSVASAGFANGTPPQSLMVPSIWTGLPIDNNGNPYIQLVSGDTIQVTFATAITAATVVNVYVACNDL